MEKIIIERTDANELGQQFHVRHVSGNGKRTFWCENLKTAASAKKAIVSHAETYLGRGHASIVKDAWPYKGIRLQVQTVLGIAYVQIENLDSRTVAE